VAHNRCVDELRRPSPPPPEAMQFICSPIQDPIAQADQRESLRRLVADVRRLPEQQRSALLMRELEGMSYADLATALGVSVPAVKSLLVRARMALALAMEARETACPEIREELVLAHDRRVRPNATARRHMRDCSGCRQFRSELRGVSRQLAALTPALGPLGVAAKLLGIGGGGGAAAGGGTAALGGTAGGALASAGAFAGGAGHVATLIAATVVTAGGAVEIQGTITPPLQHPVVHHVRSAGASHLPSGSPSSPAAGAAIAYPQVVTAEAVIAAAVVHPAHVSSAAPGASSASEASTAGKALTRNPAASGRSGVAGSASSRTAKANTPGSADAGIGLPTLAASAATPSSSSSSDSATASSNSTSTTSASSSGQSTSSTSAGSPSGQSTTAGGAPTAGTAGAEGSSDPQSSSSSTGSAAS
jgi:hypothetical protein